MRRFAAQHAAQHHIWPCCAAATSILVLLGGNRPHTVTMKLPRLNTHKKRVVGFAQPSQEESPSSVLRDSPPSAESRRAAESPLSSALRRELSAPALPKLKLLARGGKKAALGRSKSHGNLLNTQPAEVPQPARSEDEPSPHASSGGSEPVRIPFG